MNRPAYFLANLALAFYNMGTIWAHEIDIFRTWKLVGQGEFHRVQRAHWRKLPYWIFTPVALALLGNAGLLWYRPSAVPAGLVGTALALQTASLLLTVFFWGRWQAQLSRDERGSASPHLTRIVSTHWIRTALISASALVLLVAGTHLYGAAPTRTVSASRFVLSGTVQGATGKDFVYVALWRRSGFLLHPVRTVRLPAAAVLKYQFEVSSGRWAVSAFEDRNGNGKLDKGLFGPTEPDGFWRAFHAWRRPRFGDVAATVDHDIRDANINLR